MKRLFSFILFAGFLLSSYADSSISKRKVDMQDTAPQKDAIRSASYWDELQNRNGVAYLPNTDDAFNGFAKQIYRNRQIKILGRFKNGFLVQLSEWQENGTPYYKAMFMENMAEFHELRDVKQHFDKDISRQKGRTIFNGTNTFYYDNGQKRNIATYKDGWRHGVCTQWDIKGQKLWEGTYIEGKEQGLFARWYKNGQMEYQRYYTGGLKSGLWNKWYENGEKKFEGRFRNGLSDGLETQWYENGQRESERNWINGEMNGVQSEWYASGQKRSEKNYQNNRQDGISLYWEPNGNMERNAIFSKGVEVRSTLFRYHENSLLKENYESGKKRSEQIWINGEMNGIQSEWYASGQKKSEKNYQNNQQNGISLYWGVNGNLKRKALFIKGVEISYHLYDYHKNGQKREEASYKNGSKNGPWKRWDKNGELIFETTYDPRFVRNEIPKVDQSQYLFKDQHTTSFGLNGEFSFKAGKSGFLSQVSLYVKKIPKNLSMSGYIESSEDGENIGIWRISKEQIIKQLQEQGSDSFGWVSIKIMEDVFVESGKQYFFVCNKIDNGTQSHGKNYFGEFLFQSSNPYKNGKFQFVRGIKDDETDLVFETYVSSQPPSLLDSSLVISGLRLLDEINRTPQQALFKNRKKESTNSFAFPSRNGLKKMRATTKLAFVTNGVDPFWGLCVGGVRVAEKQLGIKCEVLMPPKGVRDQKEMMEDLLANGVDGIAVSPIDAENQTPFLNEVASKTILITQDADAPLSDRIVYLGVNNYKAGRALGKLVKDAIPDGGEVILFVGRLEHIIARQRRQGVIDELLNRPIRMHEEIRFDPVDATNLTSLGSKYTILDTRTDNFDKWRAKSNAEDAITKYKNLKCMVGLFAYNSPACANAIREAEKLGSIKLCGFDEQDELLQAIADGHAYGTISQLPWYFGYNSIFILRDIYEGRKPSTKFIENSFAPITKANVEQFWLMKKEMAKLGKSLH